MSAPQEKKIPSGLLLLRYGYFVNAILFLLTSFSLQNKIFILGFQANNFFQAVLRILLVAVFFGLFIGFVLLSTVFYYEAVVLHFFFAVNSLLVVFTDIIPCEPFFKIDLVHISHFVMPQERVIAALNFFCNILIVAYLFAKRKHFR
jgi:hypothetical protein